MIESAIPSELRAGDTWRFLLDLSDYPAPTWDATLYFENAAESFNASASDSGTSHSFTISAATTGAKKAGRYKWFVRVTDGTVVETASEGWVDIGADPAAAGTRDHRSWARRALDAVQATIEGRASTDQQAMSIAGRSISRMTYPELRQMQTDLQAQVRTEEQGSRAGIGRNIKVRFGRG